MMYFLIETITGDKHFVSISKFADLDDLYSKIGIEEEDIVEITRFIVHSLGGTK